MAGKELNFRIGDKVYLAYEPSTSAIVEEIAYESEKCDYYVRTDGAQYTSGHRETDLLDPHTAFLVRLRELMREHNASIKAYGTGVDTVGMCVSFGTKGDEILYDNAGAVCEITDDNILNPL